MDERNKARFVPLSVSYDAQQDVLVVDGIAFSGQVLRAFARPDMLRVLRIVKREGDLVTVQQSRIDQRVADTLFGDRALVGERVTLDDFAQTRSNDRCGS